MTHAARLIAVALVPVLVTCGRAGPPAEVELSGRTMGTTFSLRIAAPGVLDLRALAVDVEETLATVDAALSTWRADSEVSRFNASGSTDWFAVSDATASVCSAARRVSAASFGAFDVTVAPLVDLWGFGSAATIAWPLEEELVAARRRVGWRSIEVRASPPALRRSRPGVRVDFSALGKGYAVDRLVDLLAERGARNFLVEVGGELSARGHAAAGEGWAVGVERPDEAESAPVCVLRLTDAALATSGDYRRYATRDGRRLSHVIDPRTGHPIDGGVASATVVHADAMHADAWATALLVLGPQRGIEVATREGLAALLLVRRGDGFAPLTTPAFDALEQEVPPRVEAPTDVPSGAGAAWIPETLATIAVMALALGALALGVRRRATPTDACAACPVETCSPSARRVEVPHELPVPSRHRA